MKILLSIGTYLPGFRGGGPVRSVANLITALGRKAQFAVVTHSADLGSRNSYPGVALNSWTVIGSQRVYYMSPRASIGAWRKILEDTEHDLLYINGFFSPGYSILPLIARRLGPRRAPTVLAPRGEFSPGALGLRGFKKLAYLKTASSVGLLRGIVWHATSEMEASHIRDAIGKDACVVVAGNVAAPIPEGARESELEKEAGSIRIAFLSRISPMKNLEFALKVLAGVRGDVEFNVFGPVEDAAYWAKCQAALRELPSNIVVKYQGEVRPDKVSAVLSEHHVLLLPTRGENFGHVISEAVSVGCVPILSDQTPWRDLEQCGAGWDIPLHDLEQFRRVVQRCVDMPKDEFSGYSSSALKLARARLGSVSADHHYDMFLEALRMPHRD